MHSLFVACLRCTPSILRAHCATTEVCLCVRCLKFVLLLPLFMRDAASMRCLTRVPLFLRPRNRPSHRDTLVFKQAFAHFDQGDVVMIQPPLCQGKGVSTSDLQVASWDSLVDSAWVPCCGSLLRPAAAQDLQSYCHITVPWCEFGRRRLVS